MGRKIPTCFCCSYLEANNIPALINWLDPDGKYIVVAPDWLSLLLSDLSWTLMYFIRFFISLVLQERKKIISISSINVERVNLPGWFGEQM